jgi:cbb3-type cytochrome oxidase subunit 1
VFGCNFFIVIAGTAISSAQSKEYAEPEWYADLWLTVVWVVYWCFAAIGGGSSRISMSPTGSTSH